MNYRPVVFLDRDGTLNVEVGYIRNLDELTLIDGAAKAIKLLNEHNIAAVLVTNQSGAARGYYSEDHIINLNSRLSQLLANQGAFLDDTYYCPHLPDSMIPKYKADCECRKPAPGMINRAFAKHEDFDRTHCFVIGDKSTDVELARNCGAKAIIVKTGYGNKVLKGEYQWKVTADYEAASIVEAVDWVLAQTAKSVKQSEVS